MGGVVGSVKNVNSTVKNCVALNSQVRGNSNVGRVVGNVSDSASLSNNYAFQNIPGTWTEAEFHHDNTNGANVAKETLASRSFWTDGDKWSTDTGPWNSSFWSIENDKLLPELIIIGTDGIKLHGQDSMLPFHMRDDIFFTGSGTEETPYQIKTAEDLAKLAELVNAVSQTYINAYYRLENDIDLSSYRSDGGWTPIGTLNNPFKGYFDGNNKKIIGLFINRGGESYQGLFGSIDSAMIVNLGVTEVKITGNMYVGGVAGYVNNNSTIQNCYSSGSVIGKEVNGNASAGSYVGGVAGEVKSSTVQNCNSTCNVNGLVKVGGVIGNLTGSYNSPGKVEKCYSTGMVNGPGGSTGGVVGSVESNSTVQKCYSAGIVSGNGSTRNRSSVGGVVGNLTGTVQNCYSIASVSAMKDVGGVVGVVANGSKVENCYSTGSVSGNENVGGVTGFVASGTTVANCYSTGSVKGSNSVGGVAGSVNAGTVKNSVALNSSVSLTGSGKNIGRVAGVVSGSSLANNYAFNGISGKWENKSTEEQEGKDGKDITRSDLFNSNNNTTDGFWLGKTQWSEDDWFFAQNKLPILLELEGQSGDSGIYLMQRDIKYATLTPGSFTFNGSKQVPRLTYAGETLVEGTDYTLTITSSDENGNSSGINAGTVEIRIEGLGNYYGTNSFTYTH